MNVLAVKSLSISVLLSLVMLLTGCGGSESSTESSLLNPNLTFFTDYQIIEGDEAIIEFTLDKSTLHQVTFDYQTISEGKSGNAIAGTDYIAISGTVTIAAGQKSASIKLTSLDTAASRSETTLTIQLSNIIGANTTSQQVNITILDNGPTLTFTTVQEVNEGDELDIAFQLSKASIHDVSFEYETIDGSAKQGVHYQHKKGTFTIKAGFLKAFIKLKTIDETLVEINNNFTIKLTKITGATIDPTIHFHEVNIVIVDNEPQLSFSSNTTIGKRHGVSISFSLSTTSIHDVSFSYTATDEHNNIIQGQVTFLAGSTTETLTLATYSDIAGSAAKEFKLQITSPIGAYIKNLQLGDTVELKINVADNTPTLSFDKSFKVTEGELAEIKFHLSEVSSHDVTITYQTVDDTATAGTHYKRTAGNLVIKSGSLQGILTIPTFDLTISQPTKRFALSLIGITGALTSSQQIDIKIYDNSPTLLFYNNLQTDEGLSAEIGFSLSQVSSHDVTITYQTVDDTAIAGTHYQKSEGTLVIKAGALRGFLPIPTMTQTTIQTPKRFMVKLESVEGANVHSQQIVINIIDNSQVVHFERQIHVNESEYASIRFYLLSPTGKRIAIKYKTVSGSAKEDIDFKAASGLAFIGIIPSSIELNIKTLANINSHEDSSFTLVITEIEGAKFDPEPIVINIINNDPVLTFKDQYFIEEGQAANIEFTLSQGVDSQVTLKYETSDGSAVSGVHYERSSGLIPITNSYDSAGNPIYRTTLPLLSIANDLIEPDREFYFNVLEINGATTTTQQAKITITDAPSSLKFGFDQPKTIASYQAGKIDIPFSVSQANSEPTTFNFTISGTAVAGEDYQLISSHQATITGGEKVGYIPITIIDNGLARSGKTIKIELTTAAGFTLTEQAQHDILLTGNYALNDTGALTNDDAEYGRDKTLNDDSDGKAGFSFTKMDEQGNKVSADSRLFSCVLDNVTGLVYETKQQLRLSNHQVYNAKLSDDEIALLAKPPEQVTHQNIHDLFPDDFQNITGLDWDKMSGFKKNQKAFKAINTLDNDEITKLLTSSNRKSGTALKYPFNNNQKQLHSGWRSNDNQYSWLNDDMATNGGRSGSLFEFNNKSYPISASCVFPHTDMDNYVSDIEGCNSRDYLIVMNNLAVCGYSDWRLPTIEELRSIVNYDIRSFRWDQNFMPNTNNRGTYQSATPSVGNDASMWCVDANSGETKLCHKQMPHFIRAIRGTH